LTSSVKPLMVVNCWWVPSRATSSKLLGWPVGQLTDKMTWSVGS
jgi:hypothetical protein